MFSGIVEAIGSIIMITQKAAEQARIVIQVPRAIFRTLKVNMSISVQGVCLTVTQRNRSARTITADVISSTYTRTTVKEWNVGTKVNLERSLMVGDSFDGHIVQGHVTGTAIVKKVVSNDHERRISFLVDDEQRDAILPQGSVAVDGVSLTIRECKKEEFEVGIIPHTLINTTIQYLCQGMRVNIETDLFLRYLAAQRALLKART